MRKTKLVWSLAALIVVVLGGGVVAYAQLGPTSPSSPSAQFSTTTVPSTQSTTIPTSPTTLPLAQSSAQAEAAKRPAATTVPVRPPTHPAPANPVGARPTTGGLYVVKAHDTLWNLAASHLGNPLLWTKVYALNKDRVEPGGRIFSNPNLIYPGWTIEFPATSSTGVSS
jgi:nucleoid-associated protein YgaU